ncbi:hypothetical protein AMS68_001499 [Peltaster fructicola]|uniref:Uncharacterized protein n=1 Tax=Peltaster fructicola TaxID=286661 RepID=A0A6H0XMJ9_9PEZI|nr:hypothetical protein AMS68_001499 [Peltaster fructicola]
MTEVTTKALATSNAPSMDSCKHNHGAIIVETEIELSSDDESEYLALPGHIISSPYTDATHQLDLCTLTPPFAGFAKALISMNNIRPDYATAPYQESFNWNEIAESFSKQAVGDISFFVIVFRSRLKLDADRDLLGELDKAAHLEAVEAGGLLKYWFGTPDDNRRNLATCLWRARQDASLGGVGPGHAAAMLAARNMYDEWLVERLKLTVDASLGTWSFTPWVD